MFHYNLHITPSKESEEDRRVEKKGERVGGEKERKRGEGRSGKEKKEGGRRRGITYHSLKDKHPSPSLSTCFIIASTAFSEIFKLYIFCKLDLTYKVVNKHSRSPLFLSPILIHTFPFLTSCLSNLPSRFVSILSKTARNCSDLEET